MKKIPYILALLFIISQTFAFDESCFEYSWNITWVENKTIKVITDDINNYYFQDDRLLDTKIYKDYKKKYIPYSSEIDTNKINDNDYQTFFEFDQYNKNKELTIKFNIPILKDTFNYEFITDNYNYSFEISKDGKDWFKIDTNLSDYDLFYVKIIFNNETLKNTKIYELNFFELWDYEILVNSLSKNNIKIYRNNICQNTDLENKVHLSNNFLIDIHTKSYPWKLQKNTYFDISHKNEYKKIDTDWDYINDINDNCINYYNPDQKDTLWNGIWDICSDVDTDGILWYIDNCQYIANSDQIDINNNSIWDACEFDKDKDSIFDSRDNCINISNPDQIDSDNDGIWDSCDNCKKFNPTQIDNDKNNIWDECEIKEEKQDTDNDTILDTDDNCIYISNNNQQDTDNDGIWDSCDNCKKIQNQNQEDENSNKIWDACEDIDSDGVIGYLDNCSNIWNKDQKDQNNNKVWDACEDDDGDSIVNILDNCIIKQNPDQKDIDGDKIGDACDEKDNRYIESNKNLFIWILISVVILFLVWIYAMIRKLQNMKK